MQTLRKTLVVPENHKLHFDITLPANFPTGKTEVTLTFAPKTSTKSAANKAGILELAGSLKGSPHFGGDPVTLQRAMRTV